MSKADIIILIGIIVACIWLMTYILVADDKKRKLILAVGVGVDVVLYLIGKNTDLLLIGIVGGFIFSFFPGRSKRQYENAIQNTKGFKNYMEVFVVFTVMIFMIVSIAYPDVQIVWE